jgi:hypothetical protein
LWVLRPEHGDDAGVLVGLRWSEIGHPTNHEVGQPLPILVVVVHDERDVWPLLDVPNSPELSRASSLRLGIDRNVDGITGDDETNRHDVRTTGRVDGGKMRHPVSFQIP